MIKFYLLINGMCVTVYYLTVLKFCLLIFIVIVLYNDTNNNNKYLQNIHMLQE